MYSPDSAALPSTDATAERPRDTVSEAIAGGEECSLAREVVDGLSRHAGKEIPSFWFYDELGSILFEAITLLPDYGVARADERVIGRAASPIAALLRPHALVVELGSGVGRKTGVILFEMLRQGRVDYAPIDVSASALEACGDKFEGVPDLEIHPVVGSYLDGLSSALARRMPGQDLLLLFLGSTIGNFSREDLPDFLGDIRRMLKQGDRLLLGADLDKSPHLLQRAYDDPMGVTAAFNKNILAHLNSAFRGDFDLALFEHEAVYNRAERRIEMYLRSVARQAVCLRDLDLRITLEAGERIRTELSHKFLPEELRRLAQAAEFLPEREWRDAEWPFAECLWRAA